MLYILIAILMFGLLIAVHEFGHFFTAKLLGVKVNEFSIGMGPELFSRKKGETQYSLRLLPIGGFCAMEGEEGDSSDPRSFENKAAWRKVIILVVGSFMNFLTGVVILLLLSIPARAYLLPVVSSFSEGYGLEDSGLQIGDRFLEIDGHPVWIFGDAKLLLDRAGDTVDVVVERDGARVVLDDLHIPYQERQTEQGMTRLRGINLGAVERPATLLVKVEMSVKQSLDYVRMVWFSLGDLIRGAVGFQDISGPIGIVNTIGEVGSQSATPMQAVQNVMSLVAFIAINLAVMNLLPIPALDGGRIFFLLINTVVTLFTHKKLDPKYENAVNVAGFFCLLALMAVVAVNDVYKLIQ